MAVLANMWLRGAKKRLGGTVLYTQAGRTLQRELAPSVSNPRTSAQMQQRVKWANLVSFYRANASWMKKAFETKKNTQSDYNKFVSLNVASSKVYLTKSEASQGACVCAPYKVADGTLQPVSVYASAQDWVTNLFCTGLTKIDSDTTVGAFSTALLNSNAGLQAGDQLSFIRVTQFINQQTGIPYVQVRAYEVLLNRTSTSLLGSYWPVDLVSVGELQELPALMVINNNNQGGFAIIVSRTQSGRVLVSTSTITGVNMASLLQQYSSSTQLAKAIDSYGKSTDVFLDSNTANSASGEATTLSLMRIASAKYPNSEFDTGSQLDFSSSGFDEGAIFVFNDSISGDFEQVKLLIDGTTKYTYTEGTVSSNKITVASDLSLQVSDANKTVKFEITISGVIYTAEFTFIESSIE